MSTKIVCVNIGDKFEGHDYVGKLYRALSRNITKPFEFECIINSRHPGWWAKMDIFPAKERTIYLDLDHVITGNCDFLFDYEGPFCIRFNEWSQLRLDASVMSIAPGFGVDMRKLFDIDPKTIIRNFHSDQEFISSIYNRDEVSTWQVVAPGKTKSYKADCLEDGPGRASLVHFHGQPKPHELPKGHWLEEFWI